MNWNARWIWHILFWGALAPLVVLIAQLLSRDLGPDPGKTLTEELGRWGLIFLLLTLTLTPLKRFLNIPLLRYRRMIGLYAFFYACLHVTAYLLFLADFQALWEDLLKRPYIMVGAAAFLILLALAVTSPRSMVRRLGKRWRTLHKGVYAAAILVVVHFLWQARADLGEPIAYGAVLAVLLLSRVKRRTVLPASSSSRNA